MLARTKDTSKVNDTIPIPVRHLLLATMLAYTIYDNTKSVGIISRIQVSQYDDLQPTE